MNWVFAVLWCSVCVICQGEEFVKLYSDGTSKLDDRKNLRKALLEAIEQLESENVNRNIESATLRSYPQIDLLTSDEDNRNSAYSRKIRDRVSKQEASITSVSDVHNDNVVVHTFSVNTPQRNSSQNKGFENRSATDNIISASVTSSISKGGINNKIFNIPSNHKIDRSILPTPSAPVTQKTKLTSPNPTISTPTEEDETKAKVEDVQFIHAPLVAAFTVEQDDKGLPRKVIPIFGNKTPQPNNKNPTQDQIRQYQASLEEQQRNLEQQIKTLQEQRLQQEYLLKQQQFYHEQKQRQLLEEQRKLYTKSPLLTTEPTLFEKPSFFVKPKEIPGPVIALQPTISVQPSISFQPSTFPHIQQGPFNQLHLTSQSLPVKSPTNFQNQNTFAFINQQQLPHQFQHNSFNNNNYLQEFLYRQRTLVPPPRSNRVFRQEIQVGNFGINDVTRNQLNSGNFRPINDYTFQTNTFFNDQRNLHHNAPFFTNFNNPQVQRNNIDKRLKNLIYQSGLGQGRTQEDLNIVSKVLALDHTGHSNFLFGESNISERRIPFRHFDRKRILHPETV